MAKVITPRERWIERGLRALARGGPQAVRVEVLANELGVTKGGFYWHFPDRRALLDAMLDAWEQEGVDDIVGRIDAHGGSGRERLGELFELAMAVPERTPIELAIRDWARTDDDVRARLTRVDNRRMAYMRQLFEDFVDDPLEIEARCFLAFTTFVGHSFVAATHGEHKRGDVVLRSLQLLLSSE